MAMLKRRLAYRGLVTPYGSLDLANIGSGNDEPNSSMRSCGIYLKSASEENNKTISTWYEFEN